MKNLYIDFDGVILDTIKVTYELLKKEGIDKKDEPNVIKFYSRLDWKDLLLTTPIINDAHITIQKVIDSGRFNVTILTHVVSLDEAVEKVKYIRKYFKDITVIPVPKAISKTKMVHTKDAILIDDYAKNLVEWEEEGGIGILFSTELEEKGYPVINYLDQILDMNL
ncbi:MAG: hypothetical protein ACM3O4_04885 [Ignavibacteriales bacterium]